MFVVFLLIVARRLIIQHQAFNIQHFFSPRVFIAFYIKKALFIMKKGPQKKLNLGKIKIASLSENEQQMVKGGIPQPTAPIICQPTKKVTCACTVTKTVVYTTVLNTTIKANF
jgi:hypothetical protein